jgi:CheY-like chemotaxis protein
MKSFYSIILVDDDPINNLINKRLITKLKLSMRVEEFLGAETALERIKSLKADEKILLFLDINMPVMNGWDFLKNYLEIFNERNDKIVILSSSIDFQDKEKAKLFSCVQGFIEKPLTPEKIKNII